MAKNMLSNDLQLRIELIITYTQIHTHFVEPKCISCAAMSLNTRRHLSETKAYYKNRIPTLFHKAGNKGASASTVACLFVFNGN